MNKNRVFSVLNMETTSSSIVNTSEGSSALICTTLCKFSAEEEGDLSFDEGESLTIIGVRKDDWWQAQNSSGEIGFVPSNFLKVPYHIKSVMKGIIEFENQKEQNVSKEESVEPLSESSCIPPGFRQSKLLQLLKRDSRYMMGSFMSPKLDSFGLSFDDINYDTTTGSLKTNSTFIEKIVELVAVRQVPQPPAGYTTRSCQIRMCLHDGNKVLSNIHTVKAHPDENSTKLWSFKTKITSKTSCVEDGEVFIRTDIGYPTLGILFELCISFEKPFCEEYEMSCGWAFMRLLNDSGDPVKSKKRMLKVQQGELFASHDSHMASPGKSGLWQKLRDQQKMTRILVDLNNPDKSFSQQMGFLPSTLIGPFSCINVTSLYRKVLCDDLLQRSSFDSTDYIQSPLLASIPKIFNELDILNFMRKLWLEEMKSFKSSSIRGEKSKKKAFRSFFIRTIYPVINSNMLSPYLLGQWNSLKLREQVFAQIIEIKKNCKDGILALSSEMVFSPLSMSLLCTRITH